MNKPTVDLKHYRELFATLAQNPDAVLEIEASMNYWVTAQWQEALVQLVIGTRVRVKPGQDLDKPIFVLSDEEIENLTVRNVDARTVEKAVVTKLAGPLTIEAKPYWSFEDCYNGYDAAEVQSLLAETRVKTVIECAAIVASASNWGPPIADRVRDLLKKEPKCQEH